MNEDALVARLRKMSGDGRAAGVLLGIGDDCALFRPRASEDLLLKTDQLIEQVHFASGAEPETIGARALARTLSDIAAMGGDPRCCLVALAVPRDTTEQWIMRFFRGLLRVARRTGTVLAGGDLAHSERIHCTVMLCGAVRRGQALRRDGARPGDAVYVSGRLGKAWDRPIQPRLALGKQLVGRASACMDLSDGLALDLHRLCVASGVAAELDRVPTVRGATIERALHCGEDYELLFTMPPGSASAKRVPRGCFSVGRVVKGTPGDIVYQGRSLEPRGFDHFA
jgi:thiamine-monophosphate kinase